MTTLLSKLLDRPIDFYPCFVDLTGSVTSALLLSQAVYWTRHATLSDGWFCKTQAEWQEKTGLSRFEQESARKKLRSLSFWQEKKEGLPARLYFRIDLEALKLELEKLADHRFGRNP